MDNVKLIVISTSFYRAIYRLKNDVLQNVFLESKLNKSPKINDIYLAQVSEINASIGGVFVSLGNNQKAFLKLGKSKDALRVGEKVIVQVTKEETLPNKLAVVTRDIGINGSLIRFKPKSPNIIFSKKLTEQDRINIVEALEYNHEDGNGFMIRSLYKHSMLDDLVAEYKTINAKWTEIINKKNIGLLWGFDYLENVVLSNSKLFPDEIISDSLDDFKSVKEVTSKYGIKASIHDKKEDILDYYELREYLNEISNNHMYLNDYLSLIFYEHDAFNYIDVDFSGELSMNNSKEEDLYQANMDILPHIVHQILLRNLSGQILIDVLKVTNKQYRNNILAQAKKMFDFSEVKTTVLGFSNLGLLEVSRQKNQDSFNVLLSKSFEARAFMCLLDIKKLISDGVKNISIDINSKDLDKLQSLASKDLEELNLRLENKIKFNIDERIKTPKVKV